MNEFYTISGSQIDGKTIKCIASFNKEHPIFAGHFPGQPVVPGVCMMQMVKELLEKELAKDLILRSTGQVKFLQLITPDIVPEVLITWKEDSMGYRVNAVFSGESDLFKLTGIYEVVS